MTEGSLTPIRLSKAAKEFNVGTSTIVEFLSKKGQHVDPNPNTKLTPEMFALIVKEYQSEKQVKEVSQKLGIEHGGRKTITAEVVTKKNYNYDDEDDSDNQELIIKNVNTAFADSRSLKVEKPSTNQDTVANKPVVKETVAEAIVQKPLESETETISQKPVVTPTEPEAVIAVKTETTVSGIEEVTKITESTPSEPIVSPETIAQAHAEPLIESVNEVEVRQTEKPVDSQQPNKDTIVYDYENFTEGASNDGDLKILGKLDLENLNLRTKPDRKSKAQRIREAEERKQVREKDLKSEKTAKIEPIVQAKVETPVEKAASPISSPEPVSPVQPTIDRPVNFMPTEVRKLEGVKILGNIELPDARKAKPKPVASSAEEKLSTSQKKKKRKRIKNKQEVSATPATTGSGSTDSQNKPQQHQPQGQTKSHPYKGKSTQPPRREEKVEVTEEDIQRQIKETLARLSPTGKSKTSKHRRHKRDAASSSMMEEMARNEQDKAILKVTEFVTANELATMMNIPVNRVIGTCMSLGLFVSINQRLDAETLTLVAEEFGFKVEFISADVQEAIAEHESVDRPEDLTERAPIVTVMGHVDHGKTLLLDFIRKANVIAGEAGGITQHIGAYEVFNESGKKIVFLDTPGHEAFTAMRARGAKITDVAIIVIAADDSVMPQTKEAINHAQAAGVPIVFAFNKIDKPSANAEKIREQLANLNILVEDWGGKYQCQEISAKTGKGIDLLLEKVLLESEILELKGNPTRLAKGTVIESSLDKGRGYVAKILVQDGTMRNGDIVLAGSTYGKVRAMFNERNQQIKEAGPATPLLLLGLNGAPQAGDVFNVMNDEKEVKNIAFKRQQLQREQGLRTQKHITLDEIGRRIAIGDFKELNLIVKADVDGSVEALSDSLLKLSTREVQVNVIHKSVGAISESDVLLASASNAIVIGFNVRPSLQARKLAENEEIDIRLYSIIYQAIDEIKSAIEGMLSPEIEEVITSNIEIREVFKITKVGTVAGCMVLDGKISRNTRIRLIRDGIVIYSGALGSLKRFKDDVKEVSAGYECGLNIDGFNDLKVGDIVEGYTEKEVSRKL
ncbi:MAG: translation initiation factor IF-2 [Bacteroidales bacterium]|nr:translation initiation factor IF-2 [Bacteroidales bacterium]